jgi:hypothetical protein
MTISREEFLRSLPGAVADVPFEVAGGVIRHRGTDRSWRIELEPLRDLALGALALPRHRVVVHLEGYDVTAARRWLERFELHYRRGGG